MEASKVKEYSEDRHTSSHSSTCREAADKTGEETKATTTRQESWRSCFAVCIPRAPKRRAFSLKDYCMNNLPIVVHSCLGHHTMSRFRILSRGRVMVTDLLASGCIQGLRLGKMKFSRRSLSSGRWLGLRVSQEVRVDVWQDTSARDCRRDELVEFLVSADGELEMSRRDTLDLEILGRVSSELEHLCREVLEDGGCVDGGRRTHSHIVLRSRLQEPSHTSDWELESCTGRV